MDGLNFRERLQQLSRPKHSCMQKTICEANYFILSSQGAEKDASQRMYVY